MINVRNILQTGESAMKDRSKDTAKKKITSKQVVALIGVALLAVLYIITLIVAIVDNSSSGRWFWMCLFATMAVPLLIWIYTWIYGKLTGRHTIADLYEKDNPTNETKQD